MPLSETFFGKNLNYHNATQHQKKCNILKYKKKAKPKNVKAHTIEVQHNRNIIMQQPNSKKCSTQWWCGQIRLEWTGDGTVAGLTMSDRGGWWWGGEVADISGLLVATKGEAVRGDEEEVVAIVGGSWHPWWQSDCCGQWKVIGGGDVHWRCCGGDVGVGGEELKKWMRFPYSLSPIPIHVPFELVVEVSNGGAYTIFFLRNHCTPHPCLVARYPFHSTPRTTGKK